MTMKSIDQLLESMLDAVIEVTSAEKGLILLNDEAFLGDATAPANAGTEAGKAASHVPAHDAGAKALTGPVIRASRNVKREAIADAGGTISDSIVRKVIETGRPVIVSDALSDSQFKTSESVLALRLSSVMCAPLVSQGHVQGVLYVGNDRVKGLFERNQLDVLSIFAGQASLILQNAMLLHALRADKEKLVAELNDKRFGEIIGACPSMMEVFRKLQKVATTDISVLITGETGTGKELIAREVHRRSGPRDRTVRRHQLRRHSREPHRERAVRARQGRIHRRPSLLALGSSKWPTEARSSSTRSASCRSIYRSSYCARCRSASSFASATAKPKRSTSASSPPPIGCSKTRSGRVVSARISTIA